MKTREPGGSSLAIRPSGHQTAGLIAAPLSAQVLGARKTSAALLSSRRPLNVKAQAAADAPKELDGLEL